MALTSAGLLFKIISVLSAIYDTVLWAVGLLLPMQLLKEFAARLNIPVGLTAQLVLSSTDADRTQYNANNNPSTNSMSSPSGTFDDPSVASSSTTSSSEFKTWNHSLKYAHVSSTMDDLIGMESGAYNTCSDVETTIKPSYHRTRAGCNELFEATRLYPPPLMRSMARLRRGSSSVLAPWALAREYVDGRLILRERKCQQEYLEAHRCNSRLTLNLVSLHDTDQYLIPIEEEISETDTYAEAQTEGVVVDASAGEDCENKEVSGDEEDQTAQKGSETAAASAMMNESCRAAFDSILQQMRVPVEPLLI